MTFFSKPSAKALILLSALFINSLPAADIQYVISDEFYNNYHSLQINTSRNVFYNPGKLFESAFKRVDPEEKTITKCVSQKESRMIIHLFPGSFYNPLTRTFETDLETRIINSSGTVSKTLMINYGTVGQFSSEPVELMTQHFEKTIQKMLVALSDDLQKSNDNLNGNQCFEGLFIKRNEKHFDEQRATPKTLKFN
jgi:hypothetical protein